MLPMSQTIFSGNQQKHREVLPVVDDAVRSWVTKRDKDIVLAVYHHRVLTTPQIDALFFAPTKDTRSKKVSTRCQHRLKLLVQSGYLYRDELPQKRTEGRTPFLYTLDTKGAELMQELLELAPADLEWTPKDKAILTSDLFLKHLLATNDVRIAMTLAAQKRDWSIDLWYDDRTLKRLHNKEAVEIRRTASNGTIQKVRVAIVPDGYVALTAGEHTYHCFLETDMGTMTGQASKWGKKDWARKVMAYIQYHQSRKYKARYGTESMRVLTVTTSEKRLQTLKSVTEKAGGRNRFWFTTFEKIATADILTDPIWAKASAEGLYTLTW